MVDELNVGIAAVAAELGYEFGLFTHDNRGAQCLAPFADFLDASDVLGRNGLVFVEHEDGEQGCVDAFLYLVLSVPIPIHFLDKPMGFVYDQAVIGVGWRLR